ncbi:hypothetical protein LB577_27445 [Mesorhizobium sp. B283B1A]|uniref:hypothetical protein n=1 Tax=Mesorhizobium TaxID=68287 RepID=UPI001CD0C8E9|nr:MULTISPECIES: hypothetical protein [Mesorhizobium]MCA0050643.1 hypothetical protein [Mesorhizobium sp. B283B1A]UQS66925.1 hypothetical protein M5D98_11610 [Mesorhizobium opportunistum]
MPSAVDKSVLLIEDSRAKARAIRECVKAAFPTAEIVETDTIAIAGQLLDRRVYSGIVLDLAFNKSQQTVDLGDRPYLAGIEILQQLNEMRLPYPVIVATQHSSFQNTRYGSFESAANLATMLGTVFRRNFRALVEVDLGDTKWRENLQDLMLEHFR